MHIIKPGALCVFQKPKSVVCEVWKEKWNYWKHTTHFLSPSARAFFTYSQSVQTTPQYTTPTRESRMSSPAALPALLFTIYLPPQRNRRRRPAGSNLNRTGFIVQWLQCSPTIMHLLYYSHPDHLAHHQTQRSGHNTITTWTS